MGSEEIMFSMKLICRTSSSMHSFFPYSNKCWNVIGSEFRSLPTISLFKNSLLSLIRPTKKSSFGIYIPVRIKQIFQLRLGLSDLKSHKNSHKFLDTPSYLCACNLGAENTRLFLQMLPFFYPKNRLC